MTDDEVRRIDEKVKRLGLDAHTHYYDKTGLPISMGEWIQRWSDTAYRQIARTEVGDLTVSTVWLGLDHNFAGGKPLIFETMVFPTDSDRALQRRYHTLEEALAGHEEAVETLRAALVEDRPDTLKSA